MADKHVGPFLLGAKLGDGGMGVVYRATYTKTGQEVALKVLPLELSDDEKIVARFERELEILKKLKHPHIVQCYGGGRTGKQRFYAMEIVPGGTLSRMLKQRNQLPWQEVIEYSIQICDALHYAHSNGIIHRDLKPANLLISKDGRLKLSDFGIARDIAATALTATGRTVGTYHYMAPEQINGNSPVSHKTDLYALGCVVYEMLTGSPPFDGENPAQIFHGHLNKNIPRAAKLALDCPVWLDGLIAQLLDKNPDKRPFDAASTSLAFQEVRDKVARNVSLAGHAVSGQPTGLAVTTEVGVAKDLLKRKKSKKKETGPIYQRTWFMSLMLVLLLALMVWPFLPQTEEQLFTRAEALMKRDDPDNWRTARDKYITPLQQRFPQSRHLTVAQEWIDRLEMHNAEERLKYAARFGREPTSEGERLYIAANKYEKFGDRVTALEHYRSMIKFLETVPKSRPYQNLARRQIEAIEKSGGGKDDRAKIVADNLKKAEDLYASGQTLEARKIWRSLVTLYESNKELIPQVTQAQNRLDGKMPEKPEPEPQPEPEPAPEK